MQARATPIDALVGSGSLSIQAAALDPIERELRELSANQAVAGLQRLPSNVLNGRATNLEGRRGIRGLG